MKIKSRIKRHWLRNAFSLRNKTIKEETAVLKHMCKKLPVDYL